MKTRTIKLIQDDKQEWLEGKGIRNQVSFCTSSFEDAFSCSIPPYEEIKLTVSRCKMGGDSIKVSLYQDRCGWSAQIGKRRFTLVRAYGITAILRQLKVRKTGRRKIVWVKLSVPRQRQ